MALQKPLSLLNPWGRAQVEAIGRRQHAQMPTGVLQGVIGSGGAAPHSAGSFGGCSGWVC